MRRAVFPLNFAYRYGPARGQLGFCILLHGRELSERYTDRPLGSLRYVVSEGSSAGRILGTIIVLVGCFVFTKAMEGTAAEEEHDKEKEQRGNMKGGPETGSGAVDSANIKDIDIDVDMDTDNYDYE